MKSIILFISILILGAASPIQKNSPEKSKSFSKTKDLIYACANAGTFCHRALNRLTKEETLYDERIYFCPTIYETLQKANLANGYAFIKIYEDPDQVIDCECAKGLQHFQIKEIVSILRIKNKINVYKHKDAKVPLTKIASHPDLLKKVQNYIRKHNLSKIEVPGGSDEAASLLSSKEFDLSTGVVGCSLIGNIFPDLKCHERQIQDHSHNYDVYALIKVSKREKRIDLDNVEKEILSLTVQMHKKLKNEVSPYQVLILSETFFQKQISHQEPKAPVQLQ